MNRAIILSSLLAILLTTILWVLSKNGNSSVFIINNSLKAASQILGLFGLVLMAVSLVFGTRSRIIDRVSGGLDKAFSAHALLGSIGFIFILHHPLLLIIRALPDVSNALQYILPGSMLSYNLGIGAFYTVIIGFIFIVFIKLPYHLWFFSHQFLSVAFIAAGIHSLLIPSDVSTYLPLRVWIIFCIAAGSIAVLYGVILFKKYGPRYEHIITEVSVVDTIISVTLKPIGSRLRYNAGQFVYAVFQNLSLGGEAHPFSFTSSPSENVVRLSMKASGDYTRKLPLLKVGEKAILYGPFGAFGKSKNTDEIWVAGGIGITPFLSMLHEEKAKLSSRKITLFYSYRGDGEAGFIPEIRETIARIKNISFIEIDTSRDNRLTGEKIVQTVGVVDDCEVLLCGPVPMMEQIKKQLVALGVPESRIYYEKFSFT